MAEACLSRALTSWMFVTISNTWRSKAAAPPSPSTENTSSGQAADFQRNDAFYVSGGGEEWRLMLE